MKKIYLGPSNLANTSSDLKRTLETAGFKADFIAWSNSIHPFDYGDNKTFRIINKAQFRILGKNVPYLINRFILRPFYFLLALLRYDIFIFTKPVTFFNENTDLKILKFFKKKVVFLFLGCADRDIKFESHPEYVCNTCTDFQKQISLHCNNIEQKIASTHFFEKYADFILALPDLTTYVKNKEKIKTFKIGKPPIKINAKDRDFTGRLKISHFPSNPHVKGTQLILPVLDRLSQEEDVEILIKEEIWTRERIIKEMSDTHILIDSLARYSFGNISLEAISYGCVPMNAYPEWIAKHYEIPPVVEVTGDTLYMKLKGLINNRELLKQYAIRSQEAYEKYFNYKSVGKYYKELFNEQFTSIIKD